VAEKNAYISASCVISNNTVYKNKQVVFENKGAVLPDFFTSVYQHFAWKYPKYYKMDNLSKLGWAAAEILLQGSEVEKYPPEDVGLILSNANASLDTDTRYFETTKDIASPALFVYTLPNITTGEICIRHKFKGENAFFVFEKFDPGFLHQYVNNLLNNDTLQACICGWVDVLQEDYKVLLVLVESNGNAGNTAERFTKENIENLYSLHNG
jgi:hypothetical protein